jgi:hypothetical protein
LALLLPPLLQLPQLSQQLWLEQERVLVLPQAGLPHWGSDPLTSDA